MLFEAPIGSPKRDRRSQTGWEAFFPYYAGYSETFARKILESSELCSGSVVFDPWNGSGTTTFVAAQLGHRAIGFDLNPAMVIISRARMLPFTEIDSVEPLAKAVLQRASRDVSLEYPDPLKAWFDTKTARALRSIERSICENLVGSMTLTAHSVDLQRMSSIAAVFYVALFAVCRELARPFRSSNPTWIRKAKLDEPLVSKSRRSIERMFCSQLEAMAAVHLTQITLHDGENLPSEIKVADSTTQVLPSSSVDAVITSPPYCTRIDYTVATSVELAVISPLVRTNQIELGRMMIGSTRVPQTKISSDAAWGLTCRRFLRKVERHSSKASRGYYLNTHLDYFDKMARSLDAITSTLRRRGVAIMVVQDSFYKEVHNDLPTILSEMAVCRGLKLRRREDFYVSRSMFGINRNSKNYERRPGAIESVLCFQK